MTVMQSQDVSEKVCYAAKLADTSSKRRSHVTPIVEKEIAPHSSTLAWKIPWMEEPGVLPSLGSHRVGHD